MGSFAITCAASGLPIEADTPIRFFLLQRSRYADDRFHPEWETRTYPLKGYYDDYGSPKGYQQGPQQEVWLTGLTKDMVEVPLGENSYHEPEVTRAQTFEHLLECLWEDRVYVLPQGVTKPLPVRMAMIREDVWQALVRVMQGTNEHSYRKYPDNTLALRRDWEAGYHRSPYGNSGPEDHFGLLRRAPAEMTEQDLDDFLQTVREFEQVEACLRWTRRCWHPSDTIGPQAGEWMLHQEVLESVEQIARAQAVKVLQEDLEQTEEPDNG
jgi:hypothetical protein